MARIIFTCYWIFQLFLLLKDYCYNVTLLYNYIKVLYQKLDICDIFTHIYGYTRNLVLEKHVFVKLTIFWS